jgi:hypothetical protein
MATFAAPATAASMGDLFAPAFQRGNAPAEQAAADWQARIFNVNNDNIEQTRMPVSFNTGNPAGEIDPEALKVLAYGGPYDFNSRRAAIAAAISAQAAAKPAAPAVAAPNFNQTLNNGPLPNMAGTYYQGTGNTTFSGSPEDGPHVGDLRPAGMPNMGPFSGSPTDGNFAVDLYGPGGKPPWLDPNPGS